MWAHGIPAPMLSSCDMSIRERQGVPGVLGVPGVPGVLGVPDVLPLPPGLPGAPAPPPGAPPPVWAKARVDARQSTGSAPASIFANGRNIGSLPCAQCVLGFGVRRRVATSATGSTPTCSDLITSAALLDYIADFDLN